MDNAKMQTRNKINWGNYTVIYLTLALGIILTIASDTFLSKNNLLSMAYAVAVKFFAVIGFTYLMIMGEIDLSVGSMMAVGGMFAGLLTTVNVNAYLACLAALIICIALGLLNGFPHRSVQGSQHDDHPGQHVRTPRRGQYAGRRTDR